MKKLFTRKPLSILSAAAFISSAVFPAACYADSGKVSFVFSDSGISASGSTSGYEISDTALTISESGTYEVSGSCTNGSISIKKGTKDVKLILDGISLFSADTAPLVIGKSAGVTVLANGSTENYLGDSEQNNSDSNPDNENAENAVIKCKDGSAVTICGSGSINIDANGKNGIKSGASTDEDGSASLTIEDVSLSINASKNDAINAESDLVIKSGNLEIAAADDAIHSDYSLTIGEAGLENSPKINISSCYEGLEGANIYIYSGDIDINSTDDGINAANSDLSDYNFTLDIYGGDIFVNASRGDGIDSNGDLSVHGGNLQVFSTSEGDNSPLDSDGDFSIDGGTVLAVGNSRMAQSPTTDSQSYIVFGSAQGGFRGGNAPANSGGNEMRPGKDQDSESGSHGMRRPPEGAPSQPDNRQGSNTSDRTPPEKPDGDSQSMNRPEPPQMPNGDNQSMPGNQPQAPKNNNSNAPQMPGDRATDGIPQNGSDQNTSEINISSGDTISITTSGGSVLCSTSALRNANYVFYSDASLSDSETYTLNLNDEACKSTTVSESKTQSSFSPVNGHEKPGNQDASQPSDMPSAPETADQNPQFPNGNVTPSEGSASAVRPSDGSTPAFALFHKALNYFNLR